MKKKSKRIVRGTKETRGKEGILIRLRRVKKEYELDTKKVIEKAVKNLQELAEVAHERATSKYLPTDVRQKWMKIEVYIYQTMTAIIKDYDAKKVNEKLEELERIVQKHLEED